MGVPSYLFVFCYDITAFCVQGKIAGPQRTVRLGVGGAITGMGG